MPLTLSMVNHKLSWQLAIGLGQIFLRPNLMKSKFQHYSFGPSSVGQGLHSKQPQEQWNLYLEINLVSSTNLFILILFTEIIIPFCQNKYILCWVLNLDCWISKRTWYQLSHHYLFEWPFLSCIASGNNWKGIFLFFRLMKSYFKDINFYFSDWWERISLRAISSKFKSQKWWIIWVSKTFVN